MKNMQAFVDSVVVDQESKLALLFRAQQSRAVPLILCASKSDRREWLRRKFESRVDYEIRRYQKRKYVVGY